MSVRPERATTHIPSAEPRVKNGRLMACLMDDEFMTLSPLNESALRELRVKNYGVVGLEMAAFALAPARILDEPSATEATRFKAALHEPAGTRAQGDIPEV
jgi:transcriptional regulator GlxA family with amidase domain